MWISKKEIAVTASRIAVLKDRIDWLEKQIKQMQCQHEKIEFYKCQFRGVECRDGYQILTPYFGYLICSDCQKKIDNFIDEKDFNSAKATYLRKQADKLEGVNL